MTPKNIDKTIQKLLHGYAQHCGFTLDKDESFFSKRRFLNKSYNRIDEELHEGAKKAFVLLLDIADNPKKYLYSGRTLIYTLLPDGTRLYDNLLPIMGHHFDPSNKFLLLRLSEEIAKHINRGEKNTDKDWIYYGNDTFAGDLEAEAILKMNRSVELWNTNGLIAPFKAMIPAYHFAERQR